MMICRYPEEVWMKNQVPSIVVLVEVKTAGGLQYSIDRF